MADLQAAISELVSLRLAHELFPMWTDWGVEDSSTTIHSLGMSYILSVGQSSGFVACCEFPVAPQVRADCVWWGQDSRAPLAAFEFERLKDGRELHEKVRHLLLARHSLGGSLQVLGLILWTKQGFPASLQVGDLRSLFQRGFRDNRGRDIPGSDPSRLVILECQHREIGPGLLVVKRVEPRSTI